MHDLIVKRILNFHTSMNATQLYTDTLLQKIKNTNLTLYLITYSFFNIIISYSFSLSLAAKKNQNNAYIFAN